MSDDTDRQTALALIDKLLEMHHASTAEAESLRRTIDTLMDGIDKLDTTVKRLLRHWPERAEAAE